MASENVNDAVPEWEMLRQLQELRMRLSALETENHALRQAQQAAINERQRYWDLFQFAPVGFLQLNQDGIIEELNLAAVNLLGQAHQALKQTNFIQLLSPLEQGFCANLFRHVKYGETSRLLLNLVVADGKSSEVQLECTASMGIGQTRRLYLGLSLVHPQQHTESMLHGLMAAIPIPVFVKDAQSRMVLMNRACEKQWGLRFAEVANTDCSQFFPAEQMAHFLAVDQQVFVTGRAIEVEEVAWNAELKQNRLVHTFKSPSYDGNGKPLFLTCASVDVTERKQAEEALRRSEQSYYTHLKNVRGAVYLCLNDVDWSVTFISEGCFEITGYYPEEIVTKRIISLSALMHPDDRQAVWDKCQANLAARRKCSTEYRIINRQGEERWVLDDAQGVYAEDGELIHIHGLMTDITERKHAEQMLLSTKAHLHATLQAMPDLMFEVDIAGKIYDYHAARSQLLFVPEQQFLGKTFSDVLPPEAAAVCMQAILEAANTGFSSGATYCLLLAQGETWFDLSVAAMQPNALGERHFVFLARDISLHKQALQALARKTELLDRTGELARIGGWEVNLETMQLSWTRETFRIAEIDSMQEPALEEGINLFAPEARQVIADAVQAAMEHGTPYDLELPIITAKGRHSWVRTQGFSESSNGKVIRIFGTFKDIAERKQIAIELDRNRVLLQEVVNGSASLIYALDLQGRFILANNAFEQLFRVKPANIVGRTRQQALAGVMPPDVAQEHFENDMAVARSGQLFEIEERNVEADGTHFYHTQKHPLFDSEGKVFGVAGISTDVTQQRRIHESLQASLKDKEALLKEVHHRVKNNLQVITSLLRLEASRSEVPDTKAVLVIMQGRIRAMAELHETLCRSPSFSGIDLGAYLEQLAQQIFRAHHLPNSLIKLVLKLAPVQVDMDQATSCGLLLNELVSNCLKHGFPTQACGHVIVSLQMLNNSQLANTWCLSVCDNGVGLPPEFESKRQTSLGLQLVSDLVKQIGGELSIRSQVSESEQITQFSIVFQARMSVPLVMPS